MNGPGGKLIVSGVVKSSQMYLKKELTDILYRLFEFLPEIRMGDVDQGFSPLPVRLAPASIFSRRF